MGRQRHISHGTRVSVSFAVDLLGIANLCSLSHGRPGKLMPNVRFLPADLECGVIGGCLGGYRRRRRGMLIAISWRKAVLLSDYNSLNRTRSLLKHYTNALRLP